MTRAILLLAFSALPFAPSVTGPVTACKAISKRPVPFWNYDKLESQSTHIVIAVAIENRAAKLEDELKPPERLRDDVEGVVTTFRIQAVLKGGVREEKISIGHFKLSKSSDLFGNAPQSVDFSSSVIEVKENTPPPRLQFVLFLRKTEDGKYKFATGDHDPLYSVKQIRQFPSRR